MVGAGDAVTSSLVGPDELSAAIAGADRPVLLDVRWGLTGSPGVADYLAGHLPGAVFCDLDAVLAGPPGAGGRHPLPSIEVLQSGLRRLGVCATRPVVVYDQADSTSAARAWWMLRWAGHPDVRVLDGGLASWTAAGLSVHTGEVEVAVGNFVVRPGGLPVLDAAAAGQLAEVGVLLDARARERYAGEVEPVDAVAGHIPGAVSAPTSGNVKETGRFLDPAELRERFDALGVRAGTPVGAYCGSGVTAAHEVLALAVAGIDAALYVGSWSEWITDPSRPVATENWFGRHP